MLSNCDHGVEQGINGRGGASENWRISAPSETALEKGHVQSVLLDDSECNLFIASLETLRGRVLSDAVSLAS